jgi:hypothetical protein
VWSTPPRVGSTVGNGIQGAHAFGDGVTGFAGDIDHHVEMQVQIAKVGTD